MSAPNPELDALYRRVVAQDDRAAFDRLFRLCYGELCTFAYRFLPRKEWVEEAVLDVFTRLWHRRAEIHIQGSFRSYLYSAVRNQCLDYLRRHARAEGKWTTAMPDIGDAGQNPEQHLLYGETERRIEAAIESLPERCRLIFRLSRDQGLKYQEIADMLQISIKTVETQIGRALQRLREALEPD